MNAEQYDHTLPKLIVVEGPIGVGKTALAKRIADVLAYTSLLEDVSHNPFLTKFYQSPRHHALSTQLHFLFERINRFENLQQLDLLEPLHIADYMVEKSALYAEAALNSDELALYNTVYDKLTINASKPDLVIYLQASTPALIQRIQNKDNFQEQAITNAYLDKINQAYSRFFHYYNRAPLLIINAEHFSALEEEHNFKQLLHYIHTIQSGRHYFNPSFTNEVLL